MITWDDSMSTGILVVDAQHKELIEKYNALAAAMSSRMVSMDEAAETLDFLQFYAVWHFEREEEYFEQYNCPEAEVNKEEHAKFIEMFGQFYKKWQIEGMDSALVQETYHELGDWIVDHIVGVDSKLHLCLPDNQ